MTGTMNVSEPSSKRSYSALFTSKRLGLGLPIVPTSTRIAEPCARRNAPSKRPAPRAPLATKAPSPPRFIEFTSLFTNPSPFSAPLPLTRPSHLCVHRRASGEDRALAANRAKAIVALETTPGKRRKSVVEFEEMEHDMRHASVSDRRRSSLTPLNHLDAAPRSTLARFTPLDPSVLNDLEPPASRTHVDSPSGVRITFPLTFPSPRTPFLHAPIPAAGQRRTAFSDETFSPPLAGSHSPTSSPSLLAPCSPAPSTAAHSFTSRTSFRSLKPRSPRTSETRDFAPEVLNPPAPFIRSPSGVDVRFPLIFPARSFSSRSQSSLASNTSFDSDDAQSTLDDGDGTDDDDLASVVAEVLERSARTTRLAPSFASPFPPPFLSPATRTITSDSFSKLTFPSMPTLFPEAPTIPARRSSSSSSYRSRDEGAYTGENVGTPSTFGAHRSPVGTGFTVLVHDIFAEAFAQAPGEEQEGVKTA
ncbi:hypothetical protein JCM3770_001297 [Rhodotorula araucariae]